MMARFVSRQLQKSAASEKAVTTALTASLSDPTEKIQKKCQQLLFKQYAWREHIEEHMKSLMLFPFSCDAVRGRKVATLTAGKLLKSGWGGKSKLIVYVVFHVFLYPLRTGLICLYLSGVLTAISVLLSEEKVSVLRRDIACKIIQTAFSDISTVLRETVMGGQWLDPQPQSRHKQPLLALDSSGGAELSGSGPGQFPMAWLSLSARRANEVAEGEASAARAPRTRPHQIVVWKDLFASHREAFNASVDIDPYTEEHVLHGICMQLLDSVFTPAVETWQDWRVNSSEHEYLIEQVCTLKYRR